VYTQLASELARLHAFRPAVEPAEAGAADAWAWRTVASWLPAALARQRELCSGGEGEYAERVGAIDLEGVRDGLQQLRRRLEVRLESGVCHEQGGGA